jgi:serine protease Do
VFARPWLGIVGLSITEDISGYYNLPVDVGVLVTKVADGSPADRTGIAAGDIILRMDSGAIDSIEDLLNEIHNRKIGDRVRIAVLRRRREQTFEAILSKMP